MQQINNVLGQAVIEVSQRTTQAGPTVSSTNQNLASQFVNEIFKQLKAIFPAWGAAIRTQEEDAEARRQWMRGMVESRITTWDQVNAGLAKCRAHNSPFLPSIGQFMEWCRVAVEDKAGLPSEGEAMSAVIQELAKSPDIRDWSQFHPAVYMAYSMRQSFEWKNYSYKDFKTAFSDSWSEVKKLAKTGYNFSAVLPKPKDGVKSDNSRLLTQAEKINLTSGLLALFPGEKKDLPIGTTEAARASLERAKQLLEAGRV